MRAALLGAALGLATACRAPVAPSRAARVVSLHDVTTEMAVALGAQDRLAGLAEPVEVPASVAAAVARVPRVEGAESILAVRPTVVLGLQVVEQQSPELVAMLRARGVDVWLGHPTDLAGVLTTLNQVSQRLGVDATGLAARWQAHLPPPAAGPARRVFVYDCCDPALTAGRTAVLTDVIRRAGGRNVFDDVDADWTRVSWEEVIARKPELIVIHDYQHEGQADLDGKRARLAALRGLATVPTTVLPLGASLGGPRTFETVERLRAALGGGPG